MNLFLKIKEALRGARKIEILLLMAVLAAFLLYVSGINEKGDNMEERLERTLSQMEGVGDINVLINKESSENISGVLIVAEGAGDIGVQLALQDAVSRLLDIDVSCIEIVRMEGG